MQREGGFLLWPIDFYYFFLYYYRFFLFNFLCSLLTAHCLLPTQTRAICKSPLQQDAKPSCQYQWLMFNVQWSMINDLCSLSTTYPTSFVWLHSSFFIFHSSPHTQAHSLGYTLHSSFFTLHCPLSSYMLNLLFSALKCCNFAMFLMSISSLLLINRWSLNINR